MMYTSSIIQIRKELNDTLTFVFERPSGFKYNAGQYVIVEHKLVSEVVHRSYSLSSSPTEEHLMITVRHVPNGKMTGYLFDLLVGETLTFIGPLGKFEVDESMKEVVFISGGAGLTPFRAMAKYSLDKGFDINLKMVYGCRSPRDTLFNHEMHEFLKNPHFRLFVTVDNPDPSWKFHVGFIDMDFLKEATDGIPVGKVYFLCGPPVMINSIKANLLQLGVPEAKINIDAWG